MANQENETNTSASAPKQAPAKGQMSKGSIYLIVGVLAVALLVTLGMQIARGGLASDTPAVKITSYGEVVAALPLDTDHRQTIECDEGVNTVVVEGGTVHIEDADCAGGDCMRQGTITESGQLLVCLPHQLIVEIVPAERSQFQDPSVYTGNEQVGSGESSLDVVSR